MIRNRYGSCSRYDRRLAFRQGSFRHTRRSGGSDYRWAPGTARPLPPSALLRSPSGRAEPSAGTDSRGQLHQGGGIRSTAARHTHGTGHAPSRSALPPGNVVRAVIGRYGLTPPLGGAVTPVSMVLVCTSPRSSCSKAARATSVPRKKILSAPAAGQVPIYRKAAPIRRLSLCSALACGFFGGKPLQLCRMARRGLLASGAAAVVGACSGSSRPSLYCACAPGGGGSRPRSPPSSAPRRALLLRVRRPLRSGGCAPVVTLRYLV